jgi:hypothetical protein
MYSDTTVWLSCSDETGPAAHTTHEGFETELVAVAAGALG